MSRVQCCWKNEKKIIINCQETLKGKTYVSIPCYRRHTSVPAFFLWYEVYARLVLARSADVARSLTTQDNTAFARPCPMIACQDTGHRGVQELPEKDSWRGVRSAAALSRPAAATEDSAIIVVSTKKNNNNNNNGKYSINTFRKKFSNYTGHLLGHRLHLLFWWTGTWFLKMGAWGWGVGVGGV